MSSVAMRFKKNKLIRPPLNIGCLMDLNSGDYYMGKRGESILFGGYTSIMGIAGKPNTYKSQLAHFINFTATSRYQPDISLVYDTEGTIQETRMQKLASHIDGLDESTLFDLDNPKMVLTDNTVLGDEYFDELRKYTHEKKDRGKEVIRATPFINRDGTAANAMTPTICEIDSFSMFTVDATEELLKSNSAGSSKLNVVAMNSARYKSQIVDQLPSLTSRTGTYIVTTAHVGKEIKLEQYSPSGRTLSFMPAGLVMKRVPENLSFLTGITYYCHSLTPLHYKDKSCMFPISGKDTYIGDMDLQKISVVPWRSKTGATGQEFQLVFSQREGLKVGLSELEHLRRPNNRNAGNAKYKMGYGIEGNDITKFHLELLPEVPLTRTTVRNKIDTIPALRRALNITSELQQLAATWELREECKCTPKELYDDLIAKGYDWDILLNTRGYWVFEDVDHPLPFLSTMDLLKMRIGEYRPYWMEKDSSKVKISLKSKVKPKAKAVPKEAV